MIGNGKGAGVDDAARCQHRFVADDLRAVAHRDTVEGFQLSGGSDRQFHTRRDYDVAILVCCIRPGYIGIHFHPAESLLAGIMSG